jgi:hypothetical protein
MDNLVTFNSVRRTGRLSAILALVMILVALALAPVAMAATPPSLNLPPGQVIANHGQFGGIAGWPASYQLTLSGFGSGYDVTAGVQYPGWCLEANGQDNSNTVTLYSTYDQTMPQDELTYTDESVPIVAPGKASLGDPIPWDKVNYLLNHKQGTVKEVQTAIWGLIWGDTWDPSQYPITANAIAMVDAANANGSGFVPAPGQIIGVILYADGIGNAPSYVFQDSLIELTVPGTNAVRLAGFSAHSGKTPWGGFALLGIVLVGLVIARRRPQG